MGQHGADQQEEVADPAGGQGGVDGRAGVSLAQLPVADVRVGDRLVGRRGVRIEGHHPIDPPVRQLGQAGQVQLDLELPEIDAFQLNRVGTDGQQPALVVVPQLPELLLDLLQLLIYLPEGGYFRPVILRRLFDLAEVVRHVPQAGPELT